MLYKKFIFVRDFEYHEGVIKKGTEIFIINNAIYVNSGQITPAYYNVFFNIIDDEMKTKRHRFIKETIIPYNKI